MKWSPDEKMEAELAFEGDIFEMEDQRNWTDASFKTYCTPLARNTENCYPLPEIGIAQSSESDSLPSDRLTALKSIGFSHYRIDLWLDKPKWQASYLRVEQAQKILGWPLELVLHFGDDCTKESRWIR